VLVHPSSCLTPLTVEVVDGRRLLAGQSQEFLASQSL
jgi:hypothetical protein